MRKQRKMNGSKAKTMPKVQDKVNVEVDAYPKSVESITVGILFKTNFWHSCTRAVPPLKNVFISLN